MYKRTKQNCKKEFGWDDIANIYVLPTVVPEIQLSRGEGWDPMNCFIPATCLCLSQTSRRISNVILLLLYVFFFLVCV